MDEGEAKQSGALGLVGDEEGPNHSRAFLSLNVVNLRPERRCFRIFVLAIIVTAIALLSGLSVVPSLWSTGKKTTYDISPLGADGAGVGLMLRVDSCHVSLRAEGSYTAVVQTSFRDDVEVAWEPSSGTLSVNNKRSRDTKYRGWSCAVAVTVPKIESGRPSGAQLSSVRVAFTGAFTGSLTMASGVRIAGGLWVERTDTAHGFTEVSLSPGVHVGGNVTVAVGDGLVDLFSVRSGDGTAGNGGPDLGVAAASFVGGGINVTTTTAPIRVAVPGPSARLTSGIIAPGTMAGRAGAPPLCLVAPTDGATPFVSLPPTDPSGPLLLRAGGQSSPSSSTPVILETASGAVWVGVGASGLLYASGQRLGYMTNGGVGTAPPAAAFAQTHLATLTNSLQRDKPAVGYFDVRGPAAPAGTFMWTSNKLYAIFPPIYLSVSTFTLLAPPSVRKALPLLPGGCPGTDASVTVDNLKRITDLLESALGSLWKPEEGRIFFHSSSSSSSSDPVELSSPGGMSSSSSSSSSSSTGSLAAQVFGHRRYQVLEEDITGISFLDVFELAKYTYPELTLLILNVLLSCGSALFFTYFLHKAYNGRREAHLERFGALYFGGGWQARRDEVYEEAGPLFMAEFLVGFPGELRGYCKMTLTVIVHVIVVGLPCVPLAVLLGLYDAGVRQYRDTTFIAVLPGILIPVMLVYLAIALLYAILYYLRISWRKRRVFGWIFRAAFFVVTFLSTVYLVNCCLWILVGALLRPNDIFPYAGAMLLLIAQVAASSGRVRRLVAKLRAKEEDNEDDIKKDPDVVLKSKEFTVKATGKLSLKDSLSILQDSQVFEIEATSVKEQIAHELYVTFGLVSLFTFILTVFRAFGNSSGLTSALTTFMLFIGGGSVNFPLMQESDEEKQRNWERRVKAHAKKRAAGGAEMDTITVRNPVKAE